MTQLAKAGEVEVRGVTKTFPSRHGRVVAVDSVDLHLRRGEFVCLLGPSGCGKSTLLSVIAGFLTPDSGTVLVAGTPVSTPGADRCVIFQSPALFPWLTVIDNVLFGPKAQRRDRSRSRKRARDLLQEFGLGSFEHHYPHQLSGGMQQRVAVARALINDPEILLLDEPFAALDALTRNQMQEFLLGVWDERPMTALFVTHDIEEALLLADRVCIMSAHPPRIIQELDVNLERPRSQATLELPAFSHLRRRIRASIGGLLDEI
jgi:NitT/TauT family transport system ATP-binding protein